MVPGDAVLPDKLTEGPGPPSQDELLVALGRLPGSLRQHLQEVFQEPVYYADGRRMDADIESTIRLYAVLSRYDDIYKAREALKVIIRLVRNDEVGYLRECPVCERYFFAGRIKQRGCSPACNKKLRQKDWLRNHPDYKAPSRRKSPSQVENVRRCLKLLENPPRTRENEMEVAVAADIPWKQCKAAWDFIDMETKGDAITKRAKTARKR